MSWVRQHVDASVLISLVVSLGLLAYVSYVGAARDSANQLWLIVQRTWLPILLLTIPYVASRAIVWYRLLQELGIRVPARQMVAAFAGGEITKSLPAGVYVQNILLGRLTHLSRHSTIRSATATTAMLGLESLLALPVALIVGIPGAPWVRWALLGIVGAWLLVLALASALVRYRTMHMPARISQWRRRVIETVEEFLAAGGELIALRTLWNLIPAAVYMLVYVVDLDLIMHAVGVHNVSFFHTAGIYAMVVLAVILIPIPTEIGITEFAGLGGLLAYGIPHSTAAIIMLSLRLLATGATILVAVATLVLVRAEFVGRTEGNAARPGEASARRSQ
jgi:uncharacterized membrane protein YbhN (UPF0104 family)